MKKTYRSLLGLTAVAVAWTSVPAHATPMLRLSDGVNTVTVTDQLAGDSNPADDVVTWIGSIGSWLINVSTGVSERVPRIHLDLNSVNGNVSSGGPGTLTIWFTDTDFSLSGPSSAAIGVGGTTGGTAQFTSYYDASNTAFGTSGQLGSTLVGTGAFSGTTQGMIPADGLFSLTEKAVITHSSAGYTSFNYEVNVPEPGTLALFAAALAGGIWAFRRRSWMISSLKC